MSSKPKNMGESKEKYNKFLKPRTKREFNHVLNKMYLREVMQRPILSEINNRTLPRRMIPMISDPASTNSEMASMDPDRVSLDPELVSIDAEPASTPNTDLNTNPKEKHIKHSITQLLAFIGTRPCCGQIHGITPDTD